MSRRKTQVVTLIGLLIAIAFITLKLTEARAQQANSLTIGAFTIDATGATALTVKPPTRAGTLAITADIPAPGNNIIAGQAVLTGGTVTVTFPAFAAVPVCVAIDTTQASVIRRSAVTINSVTFEGVKDHAIEYICTAKNN